MEAKFVAWLRLIRAPNTLTAVADVLAGAALAGLSGFRPGVLWVALGSAAIYGGGIALNDVLDVEKDRTAHPERVLPSGQLGLRTAYAIAIFLFLFGAISGLLAGLAPFIITLALIAAVVIYDLLPERCVVPAAFAMGSCRGLNLFRGASVVGVFGTPSALLAAGSHLLLITFVTLVSSEEGESERRFRGAVLLPMVLPYLVPALIAFPNNHALAATLLVLGLGLAAFVLAPALKRNGSARKTVFRAVFTLIALDALYALAAEAFGTAALIAALFPLSRLLARSLRQRGS